MPHLIWGVTSRHQFKWAIKKHTGNLKGGMVVGVRNGKKYREEVMVVMSKGHKQIWAKTFPPHQTKKRKRAAGQPGGRPGFNKALKKKERIRKWDGGNQQRGPRAPSIQIGNTAP